MIKALAVVLSLTLLSGCNSFKLRNLGKSGASAGVAYIISPIAGVAALATAMAYDEIIPDTPQIGDIETKEQAAAHVATEWGYNALYAFIAFLIITNIIVPWLARRNGYAKAKSKYKEVVFKSDMKL
jgi:hypothetical protein